jgi:hypothetical protein
MRKLHGFHITDTGLDSESDHEQNLVAVLFPHSAATRFCLQSDLLLRVGILKEGREDRDEWVHMIMFEGVYVLVQ